MQQWQAEIRERQERGISVKEWCMERGLSPSAYYHRLRRRDEDRWKGVRPGRAGLCACKAVRPQALRGSGQMPGLWNRRKRGCGPFRCARTRVQKGNCAGAADSAQLLLARVAGTHHLREICQSGPALPLRHGGEALPYHAGQLGDLRCEHLCGSRMSKDEGGASFREDHPRGRNGGAGTARAREEGENRLPDVGLLCSKGSWAIQHSLRIRPHPKRRSCQTFSGRLQRVFDL